MRRFFPHLILLGLLAATVGIGFLTNSAVVGILMGATAAFLTDPVILIIAALIGGILVRQVLLVPTLVIFGLAAHVIIAEINVDLGARVTWWSALSSILAALIAGYAANALRLVWMRKPRPLVS